MNEHTEEREMAATPMSDDTLLALFHRAARFIAREYHHRGHAGHAQRRVLGIIRERGSLNQRELMDLLGVRSASLSEVLAKLEHGGLIARSRDEQDRRGHIVTLTESGAEAAGEEQNPPGDGASSAIFAPLTREERQDLGAMLIKLILSLEEEDVSRRVGGGRCHGGHGHGHGEGFRCGHGHEHGHGHRRGHGHGRGGGRGRRGGPE